MKILAVTSGKGGVGKSCVASYIGAAIAKSGEGKVLLAELGADARTVDRIVGTAGNSLFDIHDAVTGSCSPDDAIVASAYNENLFILPTCLSPKRTPVSTEEFLAIKDDIEKEYDFAVLDGVDFSVLRADLPDYIINVVTPDSICVRAGAVQTVFLRDNGARNIRLVINNVPAQIVPMPDYDDFDDIIDIVGARLAGVIPASPKLHYASNNSVGLEDDSLTPQIFDNIFRRLKGDNCPLLVK